MVTSGPVYALSVTKRVRVRRNDSPLSPATYWRLLSLSPLIMLVGMVAGGVLIVRSILVWGVDNDDYQFGPDIPISAVVLLLWAGAVVLVLLPPRGVLALRSGPFDSRLLVWSFGRRFRVWNMLAAPVCGVLAALTPFAIPTALGWSTDTPASPWIGLPIALALTVIAAGMVGLVLRSALHGVELTPTHLIARGYLWTRRYSRQEIVSINAVALKFWPSTLLWMLMNTDVEHTLQLSLANGREPLLFASNSHEADVDAGAEIIRAWRSVAAT